jgi:alanine dehydrogenase
MTLLLADGDVRAACVLPELVSSLADGLRKGGETSGALLPERVNLSHSQKFLRVMPAVLPEAGLYGLKFFQGSMAEGVRYLVLIGSLASGEVLAVMDAAFLTAARTGATSAVATDVLARADASTAGVIGSGLEARTNLLAIAAVRPLAAVRVYSRAQSRRTAFAKEMEEALRIPVTACGSPAEATEGRDIVLVATNTGHAGPVAFHGDQIEAGQHIVSIGSTSPALREIDPETFARADRVVFDARPEQVRRESGDVIELMRHSPPWDEAVLLSDLLASRVTGRHSPGDVTLFKSVGTAEQDLIAALHVYEAARRHGIGEKVRELAVPKLF